MSHTHMHTGLSLLKLAKNSTNKSESCPCSQEQKWLEGSFLPFPFCCWFAFLFHVTGFIAFMVVIKRWFSSNPWTRCTVTSQPHMLSLSSLWKVTANHPSPILSRWWPPPNSLCLCSPLPWGDMWYRNRRPGPSSGSPSRPQPLVCVVLGIYRRKARLKAGKKLHDIM